MIRVARNTTNTISIRGSITLVGPKYLCHFYSSDTGASVYCICPDTSTVASKQDLTLIEVGNGTAVPLTGSVALSPRGEWRLRIYEQASTTNLNPASANRMLYDDLCLVTGDPSEDIEYTQGTSCDPATVTNSDSTYSQDIASGSTFTLPDVTHTDSDGSPAVLPAMTPFVATVCSAVQDDFYYAIAIGHP